jgi:phosphomevalonate kinase
MILIGEYAVLEGAASLVRAVDRFAFVRLAPNNKGNFTVEAPNLSVPPQDFVITAKGKVRFNPKAIPAFVRRLDFFARLFETITLFYQKRGATIPHCDLTLDTTSFYDEALKNKIGVGSSAALTAALVQAVSDFMRDICPMNMEEALLLALRAHRSAQKGIGSGIDIASSVYGGIIEYTMIGDDAAADFKLPKKLEYPQNLHIISVWTGISASTRRMVGSINEFKEHSNLRYMEIMDNLRTISGDSCESFAKGDLTAFFKGCEDYYRQLIRLGDESGVPIISAVHMDIEKIVRESGAIYKPSGAGNGDFGIAMTDDEDIAHAVRSAVNKKGFKTVDLNTSFDGAGIVA